MIPERKVNLTMFMDDNDLIKGKAISLRKMQESDTPNIVKWRNSEKVRKYFIYQTRITEEDHKNWIVDKVLTGEVVQFIICENESGSDIGSVYIKDINMLHKKAEYGIFISEEFQGKGFGTEVAELMLQYAFEVVGMHKIYLRVLADNSRAIKAYEHAGFKQEAYLVDEVFIGNEFKNLILMASISN